MKKIIMVCLFLSICCSITSCASIIHGRRQNVTITSTPSGAIIADGRGTWTTPATIPFERKQAHLITISKPGYESQSVQLHRTLSAAVAANLLNPLPGGALIGWGVDAITGAQYELVPEVINVDLRPLAPTEKHSERMSFLQ